MYIFIKQLMFSSVSARILIDPPIWIAIGCQLDSLYRQTSPLVEEQEIFTSPIASWFLAKTLQVASSSHSLSGKVFYRSLVKDFSHQQYDPKSSQVFNWQKGEFAQGSNVN